MLGIVAIFSAFTLLPSTKSPGDSPLKPDGFTMRTLDIPKENEKPKQKQAAALTIPTQKLLSRFLVVDNKDTSDVFNDITNITIGSTTNVTDIDYGPSDVSPVDNPGTDEAAPAPTIVNNTDPVENPDIQASFPGGHQKLIEFLQNNLHSPEDINESVQVQVKFVVDFEGNLQSFDIIKDGGNSFNSEVIRVLKKMPKWIPGKKGGRNVPVYYFLPVKFTPNE